MKDIFSGGLSALSSSIVLSVITYVLIEKPILKFIRTKKQLLLFCFIFYTLIYGTSKFLENHTYQSGPVSQKVKELDTAFRDFNQNPSRPSNWTLEDDFQLNFAFTRPTISEFLNCQKIAKNKYSSTDFLYTRICETVKSNSTMNLTAVITGNSHALTASPIIHFDRRFNKVIKVSANGCVFPSDIRKRCKYIIDGSLQVIERVKPDIVFVFASHFGLLASSFRNGNEEDHQFMKFKNAISEISKHTKAIIISGADVKFPLYITPEYLRRRANGLDIESLKFPRDVS